MSLNVYWKTRMPVFSSTIERKRNLHWSEQIHYFGLWTATAYFVWTLHVALSLSDKQVLISAKCEDTFVRNLFLFPLDLIFLTRDNITRVYIYMWKAEVQSCYTLHKSLQFMQDQQKTSRTEFILRQSQRVLKWEGAKPSHLWFLHQLQSLIKNTVHFTLL